MPLTIVECVPDVEESTPRDSVVNESASSNNQLNDVNKTKHFIKINATGILSLWEQIKESL